MQPKADGTWKKCLQSNFHVKRVPFQSMYPCKENKQEKVTQEKNTFFVEPYGPLIIIHKENRKKNKSQTFLKKFQSNKNIQLKNNK